MVMMLNIELLQDVPPHKKGDRMKAYVFSSGVAYPWTRDAEIKPYEYRLVFSQEEFNKLLAQ